MGLMSPSAFLAAHKTLKTIYLYVYRSPAVFPLQGHWPKNPFQRSRTELFRLRGNQNTSQKQWSFFNYFRRGTRLIRVYTVLLQNKMYLSWHLWQNPSKHILTRLHLRPLDNVVLVTHISVLGIDKNKARLKKTLRPAAISLLSQIMLFELSPELSLPNNVSLINTTLWVSLNKVILFQMELCHSY